MEHLPDLCFDVLQHFRRAAPDTFPDMFISLVGRSFILEDIYRADSSVVKNSALRRRPFRELSRQIWQAELEEATSLF